MANEFHQLTDGQLFQYTKGPNGEWTGVVDPVATKRIFLNRVYHRLDTLVLEFLADLKKDPNSTVVSYAVDFRDEMDIPENIRTGDAGYLSTFKQDKWETFLAYVNLFGIDYQVLAQHLMWYYREMHPFHQSIHIYLEYNEDITTVDDPITYKVGPCMIVMMCKEHVLPDGTDCDYIRDMITEPPTVEGTKSPLSHQVVTSAPIDYHVTIAG